MLTRVAWAAICLVLGLAGFVSAAQTTPQTAAPTAPQAATPSTPQAPPVSKEVTIIKGNGQLLQFDKDVQRVAIAEPTIADAIVVSPTEIMVNAKGVGHTTLLVWETGAAPRQYNIAVMEDTSEIEKLRAALKEGLPPDDPIDVTGNKESVVLTGKVADAATSKRAAAMAGTYAKKVDNLLQVPPTPEPRQIMLQVKIASIDRVALTQVGFNFFSANGKLLGSTTTQQFSPPRFSQFQLPSDTLNSTSVNFSDLLNLFLFRPDLNIGATVAMLQQQNLAQILAEPNLITVEGKEASFLAGGQFPYPTITNTPTGGSIAPVVTVQFKPFGVQLTFTPTITPQGSINLQVKPEVSSLDYTNAVTIQGFLIPALTSRKVESEIILKDGETFAIAGLIDNRVTKELDKMPFVGDIPIIGNLFKSRTTQKTSTELLVTVTPHFVKPLTPDEKAKLPDMIEPFLPPVAAQKEFKKKHKKDKDDQSKPGFVGQTGYAEPPK